MRRVVVMAMAGALALAACGGSGGSLEAFCESVQNFVDLEDPFNGDPAEFADGIKEQKDRINAMVDDAPDEISDDVTTAADGFIPTLDALVDLDPTDEEAVEEAFASLDEVPSEVEAAADRVTEFALAECGIDMDA